MNYGRYDILKEVGKGSMGVVYQARDPQIDRIVAIKVLRKDRLHDDTMVKMFLKEARIVGKLNHPHIVAIFDVGEERGEIYIAMEFLEGVALSDVIKQQRLNQQEIIAVGTQIAETLHYAHQKGVVHRDIKPSNIIVQHDGQIKVTDFGIAHVEDVTGTLQTQAGDIKGTPAYMSPEQVRGKPVDGRSDIFSLGIILYEMSVGKRPFGGEGKDWIAVFDEIVKLTPAAPCKIENTLVDRNLSSVILKALQKEPVKRYQSGQELFTALNMCRIQELAAGAGTGKNTSKIMIAAGAVLVLLLVTVGSFFMLRGGKKAEPRQQVVSTAPLPAPLPSAMPHPAPAPVIPALPDNKPAPTPDPAVPAVVPSPSVLVPTAEKTVPSKVKTIESVKQLNQTNTRRDAKPSKATYLKPAEPVGATLREPPVSAGKAADNSSAQYAFLKVSSNPAGAQVYINGTLKGMTPRTIRLNLGTYRVRLSRAGYRNLETSVNLDKMAEFSISEELKSE